MIQLKTLIKDSDILTDLISRVYELRPSTYLFWRLWFRSAQLQWCYFEDIEILEITHDFCIWLKGTLDNESMTFGFAYIPPEDSSIHKHFEKTVFYQIEENINKIKRAQYSHFDIGWLECQNKWHESWYWIALGPWCL